MFNQRFFTLSHGLPAVILNEVKNLKYKSHMIITKQFYLTPGVKEMEVDAEGILCTSNPGGAGNLNDNDWDLIFGETNN